MAWVPLRRVARHEEDPPMTAVTTHDLITYVDSTAVAGQERGAGARRKVLCPNPETGQRTVLVQWDAGYQVPQVDHHLSGEYLYILAGTFVDQHHASGPGTYIHNRPGSTHQPHTPDGCT